MSRKDDEEVVKPDRIGSMDPAILKWQPPSPRSRKFGARVFEIEKWIERTGWVEREEIIEYIQKRWGPLRREQALEYVAEVVEDFKKLGLVRGRG